MALSYLQFGMTCILTFKSQKYKLFQHQKGKFGHKRLTGAEFLHETLILGTVIIILHFRIVPQC